MYIVNKRSAISAAILASAVYSSSVMAGVLGVEARALGMGNVSVATADIATAALGNPAMLAYQPDKEDFSLLVSVGALISDGDGMIDDIDAFQEATSQLANDIAAFPVGGTEADQRANANLQINDANNITAAGNALDGKLLEPSAPVAVVLGFSFKEYAMAVAFRQDIFAASGLVNVNTGPTATSPMVNTGNLVNDLATTKTEIDAITTAFSTPGSNELVIDGVTVQAFTISGAKSFNWGEQKVSIGITPKFVSATGFSSKSSINNFDTNIGDLIDSSNTDDMGSTFTMDIGVVSQLSESTQIGLLITNLIEDTLTATAANGDTLNANVGRRMTLGLAYRDEWFTVGTDIDLVEVDPVIVSTRVSSVPTQIVSSKPTQIVSFGAEFDVGDIVQLRAGVQKNIASNIGGAGDSLLTAGLGLNLGFNLDFAATFSQNTAGLIVQTGFKF